MSSPSEALPLDTTGPSGETKPADSPIEIYRHSSAHLLAAAVTELFPDAQVTIGPVIEDGFYYDFSSMSSHFSVWPFFLKSSRASRFGISFFSIGRFCLTMCAIRFSMAARSSGVNGRLTRKS